MKVQRSFKIEESTSKKLDDLCVRHGDAAWHVNNALRDYVNNQSPREYTKNAIEMLFDSFWTFGMRKANKQVAKKAFIKLMKSKSNPDEFTAFLCDDINRRIHNKQFGFDTLHPSTYLNKERWEDEHIVQKAKQNDIARSELQTRQIYAQLEANEAFGEVVGPDATALPGALDQSGGGEVNSGRTIRAGLPYVGPKDGTSKR